MRKRIILAWAVLLLIACHRQANVPEDAVRELCEYMESTYPQATLQDLYKTCYQDFFGAEHMISDTAAARAYLHSELEELRREGVQELSMPHREPTGFRHRFERVSLENIINGSMTEDELLTAFMEAAGDERLNGWAKEWSEIESIALQVHPAWQNEELQKMLHEAAVNNQAVRHSESFRNTYKPHYRIIRL